MRSGAVVALVLVACTPAPSPTDALAIEGAELIRYSLEGRDERELAISCGLRCPTLDGGMKSRGQTEWTLRWTWQQVPGGDGCQVVDVQKEQRIAVWLPEWQPPPDADMALVARWPAYLDALAAHERAHVALVLAAGEGSEERLRAAGCDQAEALSRRWIQDLEAAQRALDRQTGHGHEGGANLRGP